MAFFLLHETLPVFRTETGEPNSGKRNCLTFMIGVTIYSAIYVILKNALGMSGPVDAIVSALMCIAFADAVTMAWTYKNHYGRNILCELANPDDMEEEYVFNASTHRYRHPNAADKFQKAELDRMELHTVEASLAGVKAEDEAKKRKHAVLAHKERVRAARLIQRAFRVRLYTPPDGVMYLRAMNRFQNESM